MPHALLVNPVAPWQKKSMVKQSGLLGWDCNFHKQQRAGLQGVIVSSLLVNFTLNATVYDKTPTQSDISSKVTGVGTPATATATCTTTCPNIFNVTCLIKHLCWNRLGKLAIIVLAILAGGAPSTILLCLAQKSCMMLHVLTVEHKKHPSCRMHPTYRQPILHGVHCAYSLFWHGWAHSAHKLL